MSDGIYTALSGAIARQNQLEQVSHNLANVDTPGYRQTRQAFQEAMVDATRGVSQVRPGKVAIDLTGGAIEATGNPLDVAIAGNGFLRVEGGKGGQVALTRDGRLRMDNMGNLKTHDGRAVLDDSGAPIQLQAMPEEILIDEVGNIWDAFGMVAQLGVVDVQDQRALDPNGQGVFMTNARNLMPAAGSITQGSIEKGNVNPVRSMTEMITLQRHFDAMQNLIQTHRRLDEKAVQVVGANRI
jgi:flagellar basal-body rod protein FlgF